MSTQNALQALLQFQLQVSAAGLPPYGAERLQQELALFPEWCVQREFGQSWTAAEQAIWARVSAVLVDAIAAQPVVATCGGWPRVGDGASETPPDPSAALAGPITCDLVSVLRDTPITDDESVELDVTIRWWQQARSAGLPVDADFGEFWRQLEWMSLQRDLMLLGRHCQAKHRDAAPAVSLAPWLAGASKVALRYGPLKPLLRLLQPLQGAPLQAGYTF